MHTSKILTHLLLVLLLAYGWLRPIPLCLSLPFLVHPSFLSSLFSHGCPLTQQVWGYWRDSLLWDLTMLLVSSSWGLSLNIDAHKPDTAGLLDLLTADPVRNPGIRPTNESKCWWGRCCSYSEWLLLCFCGEENWRVTLSYNWLLP